MPNIPDAEIVARTARFDQELATLSEIFPNYLAEPTVQRALAVLREDLDVTHSLVLSLMDCVPRKYWRQFIDGATAALLSPHGATPIWAGMCAVADHRSLEARARRRRDEA